MKLIRWGAAVAAAVAAAVVAAPVALGAPAPAAPAAVAAAGVEAVGMSEHGTELIAFNSASPQGARIIGAVKGLTGGDSLVGIDYRPKNRLLYGVGKTGTVYRLDDRTAAATSVGKLSRKLEGGSFDIDFTPAGDQLRIISDIGQNLRQPFGATGPSGATVAEGKLTRKNVTAMAYDAGGRLIDIDSAKAQLVVQDPATGKLTDLGKPGAFPTMSSLSNGLDIARGVAIAVVNLNHVHTLFSVDVTKGTATRVGAFSGHVTDLSIKR
jgi:hypothetical protein